MTFEDSLRALRVRNKLYAGIFAGTIETLVHDGAADIDKTITQLDSTGTGNSAVTLADGVVGQFKIFKFIEKDGTNDAVVTPANLGDGSTITFDTEDEVAVLYFDGDDWQVVYTDATVA